MKKKELYRKLIAALSSMEVTTSPILTIILRWRKDGRECMQVVLDVPLTPGFIQVFTPTRELHQTELTDSCTHQRIEINVNGKTLYYGAK